MIELPGSLRDVIVERIDEEIDTTGADTPEGWIACFLAGLDVAAEELDEELGENLITRLEESGELEQSLPDELEEQFEDLDSPSGDDLMRVVDAVCGLTLCSTR